MNSQNYDKEFTVITDASVVERIYSAYGQIWHCIRIGKVRTSDILEDAFEYYNSIVSNKQQRLIEWHSAVYSAIGMR